MFSFFLTVLLISMSCEFTEQEKATLKPHETEFPNTSKNSVVPQPDLIVDRIVSPSSGSTWDAGNDEEVKVRVKNDAASSAPDANAGEIKVYLSQNSSLDSGDDVLGTLYYLSISAGSTYTASDDMTIPSSTSAGSYYLIVEVDATDTTGEDSSNNTKSIPITVN